MSTGANQHAISALGHPRQELARLVRQAEVFAPFTRQLFQEAGIGPGMRVLDVGSGAGDVSFLAAELVGRTGHVVGADISSTAVEYAMYRAEQLGLTNVEFIVDDPTLMDLKKYLTPWWAGSSLCITATQRRHCEDLRIKYMLSGPSHFRNLT
jgi:SAM-dependent methyltransferase